MTWLTGAHRLTMGGILPWLDGIPLVQRAGFLDGVRPTILKRPIARKTELVIASNWGCHMSRRSRAFELHSPVIRRSAYAFR